MSTTVRLRCSIAAAAAPVGQVWSVEASRHGVGAELLGQDARVVARESDRQLFRVPHDERQEDGRAGREIPQGVAIAPPADGVRRFPEEAPEDLPDTDLAQLVLEREAGAGGKHREEIGQRERHRVLAPVEVALGMEDLRGRPGRILVDGRQLGPRPALPESVHESKAARVGEEEHRPEVGRCPGENRPRGGRQDRPLEVGDVGERGEVAPLPAEARVMGERDGLALDQRLARDAFVASPGGGAEESLQVDEAVLEDVHELVGEGVSPELGGEPVREDHPLRDGIVVGGRLLGEEVRQEPRQVEIGGDEAPGGERPALGVQPRDGVLARELADDEAAPLIATLDDERGRATRRREAAYCRQLPEQPPGLGAELLGDHRLPGGERCARDESEEETEPQDRWRWAALRRRRAPGASHRVPPGTGRGAPARATVVRSRRRVATAIPPATSSAEAARRQPIGSPMTRAVASTPKSGVVRLNAASALGRYVFSRDMFAMKLNPAITTPW